MRASENKWPWRPVHITNDGEEVGEKYIERRPFEGLTGVGIISNDHLQGIQTAICAKLRNPTTIMEFTVDGTPVRTDSMLMDSAMPPFGMSPPCRMFRKYVGLEHCYKCDSKHASLLSQLNKSDFPEKLNKRIQSNIWQCCEANSAITTKLKKNAHRWYLEYDCPLMGYREVLFPVFFEEKVIAAFLIGQICLEKKLNSIKQSQKIFFEIHGVKDEIAGRISSAHDHWVKFSKYVLNNNLYVELIDNTCRELDGLEATLVEQLGLQRNEYVRKHIDLRIRSFRKRLPSRKDSSEDKWDKLWENTERQLEKLCSDFDIKYTIIFASKYLFTDEASILNVVAYTKKNLPQKLKEKIGNKELKFDLNKLPSEIRYRWTASEKDEKVFDGIEGWEGYNNETNVVQIFPVPFFPQGSLSILVGYKETNPLMSTENKPGGHLSVALQSFYTVVLSTLSAMSAVIAEERRKKALGLLTHELKVPIVAIRGAIDFMKRTPGVTEFFDENYIDDVWAWSELMGQLIDNADMSRHLSKEIQIQPTQIRLLRDVVAPGVKHAKLLIRQRGFSERSVVYDYMRSFDVFPKLWLDRNRFQQVVFNLLANAVKYAYADPEAFHVEIEGRKDETGFVILFRDWGIGIEEGMEELVFTEGFRCESARTIDVASQGLGLWIVRQIIERHGGKIRISSLRLPTEFEIKLPYSLKLRPPL